MSKRFALYGETCVVNQKFIEKRKCHVERSEASMELIFKNIDSSLPSVAQNDSAQ
jgi:hypothetical protein